MHEDQIIALAAGFGRFHTGVSLAIGDDAALLEPSGKTLVWTVDTLVENTHFLAGMPAAEIGWKCLAVNLSDLAAMNAEPLAALLSLALPANTPEIWIADFFSGLKQACAAYSVDLAGGDTVRSGEIQISLSLLGESARPITRFGAQAGDLLVVTGAFGGSAAGLDCWRKGLHQQNLLARHWHPLPRFAQARFLAQGCERLALLDTSDGLARSLQLLCQANRLGCSVDGRLIPVEDGLTALADAEQVRSWVLDGGEDYELLAAVPAQMRSQLQSDDRFAIIGELTAEPGQRIHYPEGVLQLQNRQSGFQHFGQ